MKMNAAVLCDVLGDWSIDQGYDDMLAGRIIGGVIIHDQP